MTTRPPGRRREGRGLPCAAGCGERQWRRPRCGPRRAWFQAGGRDIEHDRGGVLPAVARAARRGLRGEVEEQPLGLDRQRRLAGAALSTGERITRIGACTVLPRSAAGTFSLASDLKLEVERRTDGALATRRGTGLRSQGNSPGTAPSQPDGKLVTQRDIDDRRHVAGAALRRFFFLPIGGTTTARGSLFPLSAAARLRK